jgi:hypothetical protein
VGVATIAGQREWILVEAKANAGEVASDVSARAEESRRQIVEAFAAAGPSFGVDNTEAWLERGYQLGNRLCTLHVLNTNGAPARLLLIYFCGDDAALYPHGVGRRPAVHCPRSEAEWRAQVLDDLHAHMGWHHGRGPLGYRVHELFLPVAGAL